MRGMKSLSKQKDSESINNMLRRLLRHRTEAAEVTGRYGADGKHLSRPDKPTPPTTEYCHVDSSGKIHCEQSPDNKSYSYVDAYGRLLHTKSPHAKRMLFESKKPEDQSWSGYFYDMAKKGAGTMANAFIYAMASLAGRTAFGHLQRNAPDIFNRYMDVIRETGVAAGTMAGLQMTEPDEPVQRQPLYNARTAPIIPDSQNYASYEPSSEPVVVSSDGSIPPKIPNAPTKTDYEVFTSLGGQQYRVPNANAKQLAKDKEFNNAVDYGVRVGAIHETRSPDENMRLAERFNEWNHNPYVPVDLDLTQVKQAPADEGVYGQYVWDALYGKRNNWLEQYFGQPRPPIPDAYTIPYQEKGPTRTGPIIPNSQNAYRPRVEPPVIVKGVTAGPPFKGNKAYAYDLNYEYDPDTQTYVKLT